METTTTATADVTMTIIAEVEPTRKKKGAPEPGPELPVDESQAGVSYIEFEELKGIGNDEYNGDFDHVLETLYTNIGSDDWKVQYDTVNLLRVLNKHHRDLFMKSLTQVTPFVRDQVDNLRSNLMKNSLMLVKEVALFTHMIGGF